MFVMHYNVFCMSFSSVGFSVIHSVYLKETTVNLCIMSVTMFLSILQKNIGVNKSI